MSEQTDNIPLVSICCVTYNHASYIRECLDGFMMQKTNFTFEVLIHDDASTDGTADIIKEYEIKYPDIIKPIYQIENQYSKGISPSVTFNFPRAKGKYIAMCEGDDYWTDPFKLQKQVDVLNNNSNVSITAHNAFNKDEDKNEVSLVNNSLGHAFYAITDIIERDWFIPTNSILFRTDLYLERYHKLEVSNQDYYLLLLMLIRGEQLYYSHDVMSVYRRHSGGISNSFNCAILDNNINIILDYINSLTNNVYESSISFKKRRLASLTKWEQKTKNNIIYKLLFVTLRVLDVLHSKLYFYYYNSRRYEKKNK